MNPDRDDPLLDACLDEVLAGRSPPDLTARIMQAHAASKRIDLSALPVQLPGPPIDRVLGDVVPPPVIAGANGRAVVELPSSRPLTKRKQAAGEWQSIVVAASVLGLAAVLGLAWYATRGPQVAKNAPQDGQPTVPSVASNDSKRIDPKNANKPVAPQPNVVVATPDKPQPAIVDVTPAPSVPIIDRPQVAASDKPRVPVVSVQPVVPEPPYHQP